MLWSEMLYCALFDINLSPTAARLLTPAVTASITDSFINVLDCSVLDGKMTRLIVLEL
jgi:hypothetical protein